ncbi:MAG: muconolactone Delta-isomerase family protein [Chloroflexota bacterium]|nr:muconolactone Delta-isomerase family protein [Chloroflexota bacterium]
MKCMVTIQFRPERLTEQQRTEMMALIPQEQAHIKKLNEQGIVEAIYISADRAQVWIAMQGESTTTIEQELKSFPLYPYMQLLFTPLLDN